MLNNNKILLLIAILTTVCLNLFSVDFKIDTDNDGKIDRWMNAKISKDWKRYDINKNDKPDESCFYINESKKVYFISNEKLDYSKNGKPDIWIEYELNGKNFYSKIQADDNGDGKIDLMIMKKNDTIYLKKMDTDNDSKFDTEEEYNESGWKIKESVDTNKDGVMDDHYFFDREMILKEELDTDYDGKSDVWVTFEYNSDDSTKECIIMRDNNNDGKPDEWHYSDEKRRIIRIEKDTDYDGTVDNIKKL